MIYTDPGWRPLTFRPWPGSEGQLCPEGNKSTSVIGTLMHSLPPFSIVHLPPRVHLLFAFITDWRSSGWGLEERVNTVMHFTSSGKRFNCNRRLKTELTFKVAASSTFLHCGFMLTMTIKCSLRLMFYTMKIITATMWPVTRKMQGCL